MDANDKVKNKRMDDSPEKEKMLMQQTSTALRNQISTYQLLSRMTCYSPNCNPALPEIKSKTKDNEVQAVNPSGYTIRNYWPPRGDSRADEIGGDALSKTVIWQRNVFVSQGKKDEHAIDSGTGRDSLSLRTPFLK